MPGVIQRALAAIGLVVLSPVLAALAVAVRATSPGPVLHRATRVRAGGTFSLLKFRTMRIGAERSGPGITAAGDTRVTRVGRLLRRTKLDELPQLWNVVRGDMLLIGPRPEDPRYVDWSNPLHRRVFTAPPGISGMTALAYRDEETVLAAEALDVAASAGRAAATDEDVERAYRERVLPRKLAMDEAYLDSRSVRTDLDLIARTFGQVLRRTGRG